jgi:hypothetical protein
MVSDAGKESALEEGLFVATDVNTTSNGAAYVEITMVQQAPNKRFLVLIHPGQ